MSFFRVLFGGEAVSLTTCKSVLEFVSKNDVVADFDKKGTKIIDGVTSILNNTD